MMSTLVSQPEPLISGKLQDYRERGSKYGQGHQGSHLHQCQQPYPQKMHWQIQPITYLGQGSVLLPRTKKQNKAPLHYNISALRGLPTVDLHNNICTKNEYLCTTTSVP